MKKLLFLFLFLPFIVNGQTNGTIQKTTSTGVVRGNFGSYGLDSLVTYTGALTNGYILMYNSAKKKWDIIDPATLTPAISFASFGSTPNAQGASYSSGVITLQPASGSFPGGVTTGTQSFAGIKRLTGSRLDLDGTLNLLPGSGAYNTGYGGINLGSTNLFNFKRSDISSTGSFNFGGLTLSRTYVFPDVSGTVALTSDIPSSGSYIQNQTASPQTAGFNISGIGTAGSFSGAGTGLTGTASGLSIGGNAATASTASVSTSSAVTVATSNTIYYPTMVVGNTTSNQGLFSSPLLLSFDKDLGVLKAYNGFATSGGTSSQFLKADGSVDNNTYVTGGPFLPTSSYTGALSITPSSFALGSSTATDGNSLTIQAANSNYFQRFKNAAGTSLGGFFWDGTNMVADASGWKFTSLVTTGTARFGGNADITSSSLRVGDNISMAGGQFYYGEILDNKVRTYTTGLSGAATLNFSVHNGSAWAIPAALSNSAFSLNVPLNVASDINGLNLGVTEDIYMSTNNRDVYGRNAANSAYIQLIGTNTSDQIRIGSGGNSVILSGALTGTSATLSSLTASRLVATDGSKQLVSVTALPSGTTASTPSGSTDVVNKTYADGISSSRVPYTGATTNVNLGSNNLSGGIATFDKFYTEGGVENGGYQIHSTITQTANYSVASDDYTIRGDATSGNITITLPLTSTGRIIVVKKIDATANTVTIDVPGSDTIDGSLTKVLSTQYSGYMLQYLGASWDIISTF